VTDVPVHDPGAPAASDPTADWAPKKLMLDAAGFPPRTKRDAGVWILLAFAGFIGGQVIALVFALVGTVATGHPSSQASAFATATTPPEWYIVVSLLGLWVGFFFAPWLASRARGTGLLLADMGVRFKWIDLLGIVIGVGGQLLVSVMYWLFGKISEPIHRDISRNFNTPSTHLTGGSHGAGFVLIALMTVIGAPFFEELFFRGLILKGLLRAFTPVVPGPSTLRTIGVVGAIVVDGAIFGLAHGELLQFYGLAFFGMILATVAFRTRRLGMNMVAHASFNGLAIISILHSNGGVLR
jgi:membrane protease YdiL (CAAX protease family)